MAGCASEKTVVTIPARESAILDVPEQYALASAKIRNQSANDLAIKVFDQVSNDLKRGFGLAPNSTAEVLVERESRLILDNDNPAPIQAKILFKAGNPDLLIDATDPEYIDFVLENKSFNPIPLIIPTVMNPNLSPMSKSEVSLKKGQEILFKEKGKRYVLLVVDDRIYPGLVLDVARVLKERRKELGL